MARKTDSPVSKGPGIKATICEECSEVDLRSSTRARGPTPDSIRILRGSEPGDDDDYGPETVSSSTSHSGAGWIRR
jgi:hypothetical protein